MHRAPWKKRNLDFVLEESKDGAKRVIFRFYPRTSHCHSFGDEPPKGWKDVYKVYYTYSIFEQRKYGENPEWQTINEFSVWDECSAIGEVAVACKCLAKGLTKEKIRDERTKEEWDYEFLDNPIMAMGDGVDWTISKISDEYEYRERYRFDLWCGRKGFRFVMPKERLENFGDFLNMCCEYMLEHGEGI